MTMRQLAVSGKGTVALGDRGRARKQSRPNQALPPLTATQHNQRGPVRARVVARASSDSGGGDGGVGGPDPKQSLQTQLDLLGALMVRHPGIVGSVAVASGYFLHINALPMHWDQHDAILGLQCAVPLIVLDTLLMLPDYSPGTVEKKIKLKAPKSVAEKLKQQEEREAAGGGSEGEAAQQLKAPVAAIVSIEIDSPTITSTSSGEGSSSKTEESSSTSSSSSSKPSGWTAAVVSTVQKEGGEAPDEELVEIERTVTVRAKQHPALAALYRVQMDKVTNNVGRVLWLPLELVLLLTAHLAEEMLYRAIILTWAAGWTIERLYEGGADEVVGLLGVQLATPQAGAVFAAVGCAAVSVALLVQRTFFPLRLVAAAERDLNAAEAAPGVEPKVRKDRARMRKMLDKVKRGMVRQRRWSTGLESVREVTEWAAFSTSFLLTGNLLAPYIAAVTTDLVFSGYQRVKSAQMEAGQAEAMRTIRELHTAALAMKDARKARLQPPPVPAGKDGKEAGELDDKASSAESEADTGGSSKKEETPVTVGAAKDSD